MNPTQGAADIDTKYMEYFRTLKAVFVTGTAGCGKSLLTSKLIQWYRDSGADALSINLDPGAVDLPYEPDVDARDYVDINQIMQTYSLGPNGSLVMASDLIASKQAEIQNQIEGLNGDYAIVDTPGQIELFAYRASGPYIVENFTADEKSTIFVYDGMLISSPMNFVSISLLSTSIALRLKMSTINVLSKSDLVTERLEEIVEWSNSGKALEEALANEKATDHSFLNSELFRTLSRGGFSTELIPISSLTMSGMTELFAALARALNQGEDG